MVLSRDQVMSLDEQGLRSFLARKVGEGQYLDYKVALTGGNEREQRREFLKDATGFANAYGGDIIIGSKEPSDDTSAEDQLVGIEDGDKVAEALEDLVRDSTQIRLPGFFARPIKLSSGRWAVIAHVPYSATRPHMVDYASQRTFYIRRGSSTVPMTIQEIRDTVLAAATAEGRVKETIAARRADAVRYFQAGSPILLLQALPIVQPEQPWPVEQEPIASIVRGSDRINRYHTAGIATQFSPKITLDGVLATNNPQDVRWVWELHRSGYVSILLRLSRRKIAQADVVMLHAGYHDPFFVLAEILEQCWRATGLDVPYAVAAELFPARNSVFHTSATYDEYSDPYFRDEIVWPIHLRQPGQDPRDIARLQITDLYHAYGLQPPKVIEPRK